jgi:hypothetical protein
VYGALGPAVDCSEPAQAVRLEVFRVPVFHKLAGAEEEAGSGVFLFTFKKSKKKCVHMCIYVCMHVCMYMFAYTYIHIYIYIYICEAH